MLETPTTCFLSLPCLGSHLQAYREGSVVVVCLCPPWKPIFLELRRHQGIKGKETNRSFHLASWSWQKSEGQGKALGPKLQPVPTPEVPHCLGQSLICPLGGNFPMGSMGTADGPLRAARPLRPPSHCQPPPLLPLHNSHLLGFPRPRPNRTIITESVTTPLKGTSKISSSRRHLK